MIVWIASYPRSGNTFLRILLHRLYGVPTYVIYDIDGVANRIGSEPMGFRERPVSVKQMRNASEVYFVKTHRQRQIPVEHSDRAIYLVRDGRDSIVSWARLTTEKLLDADDYDSRYEEELQAMITRESGGTSGWGRNVLSWLAPQGTPLAVQTELRFEELIADPVGSVHRAVAATALDLQTIDGAHIPSFEELQQIDSGFFRRGIPGAHRTEMSDTLHDLFWAQTDNARAMALLGYPVR
jgi:hypothetical protein